MLPDCPTHGGIAGEFQQAPTLGGECYQLGCPVRHELGAGRFNGHPPLGVNATSSVIRALGQLRAVFQRAPTLEGECYTK